MSRHNKHNRGPLLGLLAMFGAVMAPGGPKMPSFKVGVRKGNHSQSPAEQQRIMAVAEAKRERRAKKPGASKYALANVNR